MIVIGGRAHATARYDLGASAAVEEGFVYDLTLCGWELVQLRSKEMVFRMSRSSRGRRGTGAGAMPSSGKKSLYPMRTCLRPRLARARTVHNGTPSFSLSC